jgi:hypothetical protein
MSLRYCINKAIVNSDKAMANIPCPTDLKPIATQKQMIVMTAKAYPKYRQWLFMALKYYQVSEINQYHQDCNHHTEKNRLLYA